MSPRGREAEIGTETVAQNGYTWVKTKDGWKYKHWIIAEKKLGRPIDPEEERVSFLDGNKTNFDPANLEVKPRKRGHDEDQLLRTRVSKISRRVKEAREVLDQAEADLSAIWDELESSKIERA